MLCPSCKYPRDSVTDSRSHSDGMVIRRRRKCKSCNHRWTTYEVIAEDYDLKKIKELRSQAETTINVIRQLIENHDKRMEALNV
jgi:transcriptional repressor NrdR